MRIYNIAVVVSDTTSYEEVRQIEDRLIDAAIDWDAAHGIFTLCMVCMRTKWRGLACAEG